MEETSVEESAGLEISYLSEDMYQNLTIAKSKSYKTTLYVGGTLTLKAKNGSIKTCTSSKMSVAKATKKGVITALKAGKAKIKVTTSKGIKATVNITVKANKLTGLNKKPDSAYIKAFKGAWTVKSKSVELLSNGQIVSKLYLINATGQKASYIKNLHLQYVIAGSDIRVIADHTFKKISKSCSNNKYITIKVTFPASKVYAKDICLPKCDLEDFDLLIPDSSDLKLKAGKNYYDFKFYPDDEDVPVTDITLDRESVETSIGETFYLKAVVEPENATNKVIVWDSSDESVATVSDGIVTATGIGTAVISATATDGSEVSGSMTVTVSQANEPAFEEITPPTPTPTTRFGSFSVSKLTLKQGEKTSVQISGGVTGSTIDAVTVNSINLSSPVYTMKNWGGADQFSGEIVTIDATSNGPFRQAGTYKLRLWVREKGKDTLGDNDYVDRMTVVVEPKEEPKPDFSGSKFNVSSKTLSLGETWIVPATVKVSGGTGYVGIVTINTGDYGGATLTDDFSGHKRSTANTQYYAAYMIDTSVAPWNVAGRTFTLKLWAKDSSKNGGYGVLDTMTVSIVGSK